MRPWLSAGRFSLALALCWAGAELSSWAQSTAPRRGMPLQFSGRADATNALSEQLDRKEELQNLDDGLFGLSKPATPRSSMGGLPPAIVIRRSLPSKETRELFDWRRNWMLSSPESLPGGPGTSSQTADLDELQKAGKLTAGAGLVAAISFALRNSQGPTALASLHRPRFSPRRLPRPTTWSRRSAASTSVATPERSPGCR